MRTLPNNPVVGTDWIGPVTQAKCEWEIDLTSETVTIYYRDVWTDALWRTRVPTIAAALGFSVFAIFSKAVARQIDPGVLCEVQLVFTLTSGTPTPPSTLSENASTERRPIQFHNNFNAASGTGTPPDANSPWNQYWNYSTNNWYGIPFSNAAPNYLVGLTDFPAGTSQVTVTDYFDSEPDDVEPTLGKIATPPGKTPGYYLLLTGGKNQQAQFWVRKLVYQFSATPWPTQVYPSS